MCSIKKIFVLLLCLASANGRAQNADADVLKSINPQNPDSKFWNTTSNSVYWVPAVASVTTLAAGIISNDKNIKHHARELFISAMVSTIISEAMKNSFKRVRPADKYPEEIFVTSAVHGKSFPSGHASQAFATATTLSLQYKKWYVVAPSFLWAGLVSYSRMYKGYHYPSDILAGSLVGAGSGLLSHFLTKKIFRN